MCIALPGVGVSISVVDEYKHLGKWLSLDDIQSKEAAHRVSTAMQAYSPIACRVFGNCLIAWSVRKLLACSLVFTRLFFNCHVLVPSGHFISKANSVYMTVIRRLVGLPRFDGKHGSDANARRIAGFPSIDCWIMRCRLLYLKRIIVKALGQLVALLSHRVKGSLLPWSNLIIDDMLELRKRVAWHLPDPVEGHALWLSFICSAEWKDAVEQLHFDSYVEKEAGASVTQKSPGLFTCSECAVTEEKSDFDSQKALDSHARAKHGVRCEVRCFAPESGKCPVCKAVLCTRLRLIAHLSDKRVGRDRCRNAVLSGSVTPLAPASVLRLDEADRVARRLAQQAGKSHVTAVGQAKRANGQAVGHVRK